MILRGIDRGAVFFAAADYRFFLRCLETKAAEESVSVHAYALMTNHVHVLMTAARDAGVPALMKGVASKTWSVPEVSPQVVVGCGPAGTGSAGF